MLGQLPAELFRDLEAMSLGAFGVIGPQIDVDKSPAVFVADFAAEPIDVIVVAFDGDGFRSVNGRTDDFPLFQAVGDKNITVRDPRFRGMRCDGIGQVPVDAQETVSKPNSMAFEIATETTRSLYEKVG